MLVTKTTQIVHVNDEDSSLEEKEETKPREYIRKAPFSQRLAKGKMEKSTGESFLDEQLISVEVLPWYADIVNYLITCQLPDHWTKQDKTKFFYRNKEFLLG